MPRALPMWFVVDRGDVLGSAPRGRKIGFAAVRVNTPGRGNPHRAALHDPGQMRRPRASRRQRSVVLQSMQASVIDTP
jgi:hypothetical protein